MLFFLLKILNNTKNNNWKRMSDAILLDMFQLQTYDTSVWNGKFNYFCSKEEMT